MEKGFLSRLDEVCKNEEERDEYDELLRAMFCSYMSTVLSHECSRFNMANIKRTSMCSLNHLMEAICTIELHPYYDPVGEIKTLQDFIDSIENEKLVASVKSLPQRDQHIIYLKYVKQMPDKDIAKQHDVTRQAITRKKKRILEKLLCECL